MVWNIVEQCQPYLQTPSEEPCHSSLCRYMFHDPAWNCDPSLAIPSGGCGSVAGPLHLGSGTSGVKVEGDARNLWMG